MASSSYPASLGNQICELTLYELHRSPCKPFMHDTEIAISPQSPTYELMCQICLEAFKRTMTTKGCIQRFCSDCITIVLRSGNKECPTCAARFASRLSIWSNPNFNALIPIVFPSHHKFKGIKLQTQNRLYRIVNQQYVVRNETHSTSTLIPLTLNSSSQSRNNETAMVQTKRAEKMNKIAMYSENDGAGPSSTVDASDITECIGTSNGASVDEIEIVFKERPINMANNYHFMGYLNETPVRYIKTTINATVGHLNKYLTMRLTLDYGPDISECDLNYLIYVSPSENQFIRLDDDQSLRDIQDKFWKVKKPLEIFYSFI